MCVPSAFFVLHKDLFFAVGGFDENFKYPGGEDDLFVQRTQSMGGDFLKIPDLVIWHDHKCSLVGFAKRFYRYGFGHELVCSKVPQGPCMRSISEARIVS